MHVCLHLHHWRERQSERDRARERTRERERERERGRESEREEERAREREKERLLEPESGFGFREEKTHEQISNNFPPDPLHQSYDR